MRKKISEDKEHQYRKENQTNPKMESPKMSGTKFEDFDLACSGVSRRQNSMHCITIKLTPQERISGYL